MARRAAARSRWRRAPAGEGGAPGDPAPGRRAQAPRPSGTDFSGRGHLGEDARAGPSALHEGLYQERRASNADRYRAGEEGPAGAALKEERALSAPYQLRAAAGASLVPRGCGRHLLLRGAPRTQPGAQRPHRAVRGEGLAAPPGRPAPLSPLVFWSAGRALCLRLRRHPQGAAEM